MGCQYGRPHIWPVCHVLTLRGVTHQRGPRGHVRALYGLGHMLGLWWVWAGVGAPPVDGVGIVPPILWARWVRVARARVVDIYRAGVGACGAF